MNPCFIDLTGRQFGDLTVINISTKRDTGKSAYWVVKCECGNMKDVRGDNLRRGAVKSCGMCLDTHRKQLNNVN